MREIFIEHDSFNELTVLKSTTRFRNNFDEVEVHILSFHISNMEDGLHSEVSVLLLTLGDNLGSESGHGTLSKIFVVVLGDVNLFLDLLKLLDSNFASIVETISNFKWVDTLVEELLCLLEDGTSQYDYTGSSISNFVIL